MTTNEQRIAIANACGWTDCEYIESLGLCKGKHKNSRVQYDSGHSDLPDYLGDLNAMHEAEQVLNDEQKEGYFFNLMCLYGNWPKAIQATATERAEAFLRTLGLWKPTLTQQQ